MKKLLALLCYMCAAVVVAQAGGLDEQALNAQVNKAARVVQLSVNTGNAPAEYASGKAVIVSAGGSQLVLLTSQSLAMDIDSLGDEPVFASITQGKKKAVRALIAKMSADNPGLNQHFYVLTLKGINFAKVPAVPLKEARKLLK